MFLYVIRPTFKSSTTVHPMFVAFGPVFIIDVQLHSVTWLKSVPVYCYQTAMQYMHMIQLGNGVIGGVGVSFAMEDFG